MFWTGSQTCHEFTVDVTFVPTSTGGKSGSLNIPSNDPAKPQVAVQLSGTGVQPKSITVVSPNGAEQWEGGTTKTIQWKYAGSIGSYVKIQLLKNGAKVLAVSSKTSIGNGGNGSFSWTIPANQSPGNDYRIRITSTSNASYTDMSDVSFSIVPISITLTAPNGGETWQIGTKQLIQWTYTGNSGTTVKIQLIQGTTVLRTITNSTPIGSNKAGSFSWLLPSNLTPGSNYKVRVTSTTNANYKDDSNATFSIRR
jgi:hypothetical protein